MTKLDEKALELSEELKNELGEIEVRATGYSLADAIREGSMVTDHNNSGWGDGDSVCALSAAVIAARSKGYL